MPQKQPPETTAVCWLEVLATGVSTAGTGKGPSANAAAPNISTNKMLRNERDIELPPAPDYCTYSIRVWIHGKVSVARNRVLSGLGARLLAGAVDNACMG